MKLLLIEDEPAFSSMVAAGLRRGGYTVDVVDTLSDAASAFAIYAYDLVLLDRHLPDGDGLVFLKAMRKSRRDVPVILMSAELRSVEERVRGLEEGADDYVAKPLDFGELMARSRALLRRPRQIASKGLSVGNLEFDPETRAARIDGRPVPVARRELTLLEHLIRANGRVVLRELIEQNAYGFDEAVSINAIDVSVHRLRRTLLRHGATARVQTVRGLGYMLREVEAADV